MEKIPTVTVLSMCYNKADTIVRCYESLRNQTCRDFEWIIVNDGSTDNILDLVPLFEDDLFDVIFINKPNEGIAPTWNKGVEKARGKFIFRVDPDDWVYPTAIENIIKYSTLLDCDLNLCGLVFLSTFEDGEIVGYHPFNEEITRSDFNSFRIVYEAVGDRAEVCLTSVFKEFKWPYYPDERFYPESVMWNKIGDKYDALYINVPIYIREYGDNCISANNSAVMRKNPKGYMDGAISQICTVMRYPLTAKRLLCCFKIACNYFRYGMYSNISYLKLIARLPTLYLKFSFLFGSILFLIDNCFPSLIHKLMSSLKNEKSILKRDRNNMNR